MENLLRIDFGHLRDFLNGQDINEFEYKLNFKRIDGLFEFEIIKIVLPERRGMWPSIYVKTQEEYSEVLRKIKSKCFVVMYKDNESITLF